MANSYLDISIKTWKPDNHGLFDFLAYDISKSSFKVHKPCTIFRQEQKCYIPSPTILERSVPVVSVSKLRDSFHISLDNEDSDLVMWKVVKTSKEHPKGHQLVEGDWVKLGKVIFRVNSIGDAVGDSQNQLFSSFFSRNNHFIKEEEKLAHCVQSCNSGVEEEVKDSQHESFHEREELEKDSGPEVKTLKVPKSKKTLKSPKETLVCRICLCDSSSEDNPLITPCKCSGTVSKVHVQCLQLWLKSRIQSHISAKIASLYLKDLSCELCKVDLPYKLRHNSRDFMLITLSYPLCSPFVLLEEFTFDRKQVTALHLVSINPGETLKVGRSNYSDLKIVDLTVSRTHCKIEMVGSQFFIRDRSSKFGTLIEMKRELKVKTSEIDVQVGRCVLKIVEKVPFECCRICRKKNKVDVEKSAGKTQTEVFEGLGESTGFLANRVLT